MLDRFDRYSVPFRLANARISHERTSVGLVSIPGEQCLANERKERRQSSGRTRAYCEVVGEVNELSVCLLEVLERAFEAFAIFHAQDDRSAFRQRHAVVGSGGGPRRQHDRRIRLDSRVIDQRGGVGWSTQLLTELFTHAAHDQDQVCLRARRIELQAVEGFVETLDRLGRVCDCRVIRDLLRQDVFSERLDLEVRRKFRGCCCR